MRRYLPRFALVAIVVAAATLAAAQPSSAPSQSVTKPREFVGPVRDQVLPWQVEREFQVGGESDPTFTLAPVLAKDVDVDALDRLLIVDRYESRVIVLGPDGQLVRFLGGRGRGQGQFALPLGVTATPDGGMWVWDSEKMSFVVFDSTGHALDEIPGLSMHANQVRFATPTDLVISTTRHDSTLVGWYAASEFQPVSGQAVTPGKAVDGRKCQVTDYVARPVFTPTVLWDAGHGVIASNTDGSFTISVVDTAQQEVIFRRNAVHRRASIELAKRMIGTGPLIQVMGQNKPCHLPPTEILSAVGFQTQIPAYSSLILTDAGELWAIRYAIPGENHFADVYALDRGYLGTVTLGDAQPIRALHDGRLLSLEQDSTDVPRIGVYRVRRP